MPGHPTILEYVYIVGQEPVVLAAGAGQVGCFLCVCFFFNLIYPFFLFLMCHLLGDSWTY